MKYTLAIKNPETQEIVSQKEYSSLLKMSKELNVTYCSCYNNFLFHESPNVKPAKKLSQLKFNKKYTIKSIE